jgi:hypothetical protein
MWCFYGLILHTKNNALTLHTIGHNIAGMIHPLLFAYLVWCAVEGDRAVDVPS